MKALIIIDMLNDFVTGVLANEKYANEIIPTVKKLLDYARSQPDWLVVYANDAHTENDREMQIWGKHAMAGEQGAAVIPQLQPIADGASVATDGADKREFVVPKRFYSAYDETNLGEILAKNGVTEVVLTGAHTHCCVRHTAYSSFVKGYKITVPSDAVCVFEGVDNNAAIEYLRTIYGANITTSDAIVNQN